MIHTFAAELATALRQVAPVDVLIGQRDDKSTWRLIFDPAATDEQRAAAEAAMDAFDIEMGAAPTLADVKAEARRRIEALLPRWKIDREVLGGKPIPQEVKDAAQALRARSDEIEAMSPIPADFRDDKHWPS